MLSILIIDQAIKIYIKTNFYYNEEVLVFGEWFKLLFVENRGMAFGWEIPLLGPDAAKISLSVFRVIAVGLIAFYLKKLIEKGVSTGLIFSIALILAGALGNIIDSAFYGLIFSESMRYSQIPAEFVPFGEGYAGFLTGHVVDMLRFDIFTVDLPFYGEFNFFAPIFNFADSAITAGVLYILLFERKSFQSEVFAKEEKKQLVEEE